MATNKDANNRVFLYEVVIQPQIAALNQINGLFQRRGKFYLKVSYERMNLEMQRITRLGGKIVKIIPMSSFDDLPIEEKLELPWWVEIMTTEPYCLYYFGPFDSQEEAQINQGGYIEDLEQEDANIITIEIKQCQPQILTQEFE